MFAKKYLLFYLNESSSSSGDLKALFFRSVLEVTRKSFKPLGKAAFPKD